MTYQVVASHRTGSSLLNHYAIDHNDGFGFHELFLKPAITEMQGLRFASTKQKFEFLEYYKKQDIHFSIKVFPCRVITEGYESRLLDYLDGYKILTINRNPFDTFLSCAYQSYTYWKNPHRLVEDNKFMEVSFKIDCSFIGKFCDELKATNKFINKLDIHNTFEYAELTAPNLNKYFESKFKPFTSPCGVDYKNLATNYAEAKELFYHEMYGSRNRAYD
jgi:hypothetical protein